MWKLITIFLSIQNFKWLIFNLKNLLVMLNAHLDLHPTSEDVLRKFIALWPHRVDFDI